MVLFAWVFFGIPAVPLTFALVMQWKQRGRRGKGRSLV
ncbi:hypothetical protein LF41_2429 [Lysobacter dokdonensis DS-58]|uniref:Uncharacterized protein n=1 Tax=Lysobacter dokdonensis DS-58 TaxID=1300345 RepID=A0A0A2WMG0_9GAMM|nr:hypothetical protein LF41_2429 [Lysobacter dokdonensis DS-58]